MGAREGVGQLKCRMQGLAWFRPFSTALRCQRIGLAHYPFELDGSFRDIALKRRFLISDELTLPTSGMG